MITIAIVGTYKEPDLICAIYSVLTQDYPEIELIISIDEIGISISNIINVINANRKDNVKRILIDTKKKISTKQSHIEFISNQMNGEWLLCLWEGAAIYSTEAVSKCMGLVSKNAFLESINILYKNTEQQIEKKSGVILFPLNFVKSSNFNLIDLNSNIKNQIEVYLEKKKSHNSLMFCEVPLIKSYANYHIYDYKKYTESFLNENFDQWQSDILNDRIQLNYSDFVALNDFVKNLFNCKELKIDKITSQFDWWITYIIIKDKDGKWELKNSDKALIYHLQVIKLKICKYSISDYYYIKKYLENVSVRWEKRAVIVVNDYNLWKSCYKSIYDILTANQYRVDLVYTPFVHNQIKIDLNDELQKWRNSGYSFFLGTNYNLVTESPDLVFLCKPYDVIDERWCIKEIDKIIRWIIYIPYAMSTMRDGREIKSLMYQLPMHYIAWKQLVYSRIYENLLEQYTYNSKNKLLIGHPKYDISLDDFTAEEKLLYRKIKLLAKNKQIVLWNSHFAIDKQDIDGAGTFLNFGYQFLKNIVRKSISRSYFVVWRPHPMFWEAVKNYSFVNEIEIIIQKGEDENYIYVDRSNSQWPSIFASDILVSDASSLIESWIFYNKPLILTTRIIKDTLFDPILWKATSIESLEQKLDYIIKAGDELSEKREKWINDNYYLPSKGKSVAKRLLDEIENGIFLNQSCIKNH